jgi:predicted lysophospholipase L1 biosynthesis ABC-type transport system permease subunit
MIAGILAAWSATLVEVILAKYVFKMDIVVNYLVWLIAPLSCTAIITIAGLAGTWRVLSTPPVIALRQN